MYEMVYRYELCGGVCVFIHNSGYMYTIMCASVILLRSVYMCDICENNERILVDPTSNVRSSQRLSHACLSTY